MQADEQHVQERIDPKTADLLLAPTLIRAEQLPFVVEHCRRTDVPIAPVACQYDLSPTTLYRHMRGGIHTPGGQPSFSAEQEEFFVQYLLKLSDWLVPISGNMLIEYVESFLAANRITVKRFRNNDPGKDCG